MLGCRIPFSLAAATLLVLSVVSGADQPSGPAVSPSLKPSLGAAQDALAGKRYDEALGDIRSAQSIAGVRTPYDDFVINALLVNVYGGKNDVPDGMTSLQTLVISPYASAEQQRVWYKAIAQYQFQEGNYTDAVTAAQNAVNHGAVDNDSKLLLAKAQCMVGNFGDAERQLWEIIDGQDRPDEAAVQLLWQIGVATHDTGSVNRAIDRLFPPTQRVSIINWNRREELERYIYQSKPKQRDGPLRYLNLSDDESRQIQSAIAAVMTPQFVSIGGVVTGCPVLEGPSCTDQVWVLVHRTGKTVELQMSKIGNQWAIGPTQRWWLCDDDLEARRGRFSSYDAYQSAKNKLIDDFPQCSGSLTADTTE